MIKAVGEIPQEFDNTMMLHQHYSNARLSGGCVDIRCLHQGNFSYSSVGILGKLGV